MKLGNRSATAAAAYRNGEKIVDKKTGEVHDYTRRSGVEATFEFGPIGYQNVGSELLWNRAEAAENRKNSNVAREVLVALPHELNEAQRLELVQRITAELAQRYGTAGTAAIHAPSREGDQRNWHTHILMTTRRVDIESGLLNEKTRELDDKKTTGPREILWIRKMCEIESNAALVRAGHAPRLDCRSLKDQGIERLPTIHEGPRVTAIRRKCEREGREPDECDIIMINDARRAAPLDELRAEAQQLEAQIYSLEAARQQRALKNHDEGMQSLRDKIAALDAAKPSRDIDLERREWRSAHPIRSLFGYPPHLTDAAVQQQRSELMQIDQQRQRLQQKLDAAEAFRRERWPAVYNAAQQLDAAAQQLRRADRLIENKLTFAGIDERKALHQERREIDALQREIAAARQQSRIDVDPLLQRSALHQDRIQRWDEIEQQRLAAADEQRRQLVAERLRDAPTQTQNGPRSGPRLG